jgi:hypothetical protein
MTKTTWTINVEEDEQTGDLILPLNDEILEQCGFAVGDDIEWVDRGDGSWMIQKVEKQHDTEWVLVECAATYRMRYMVEVPEGKAEWALDTVTMKEAKEFSQEYLGEQIFSHRVVTKEEALELCDQDNKYGSSWPEELKIKNFFTKEGEKPDIF